MGLLGQILGGLAGNMATGGARRPVQGGGTSRVVMALLPVVLGMLANRRGSTGGLGGMGGGLGGMGGGLGGMGGGMGGGLGGLGGLLDLFTQRGYGQHASSWVGTGPNQPLPPQALSEVFDSQQLSQIATQAGVTEEEARTGLAELLPEAVDHFTPHGALPDQDQIAHSIDDYVRQLPR